MSRRLCVALAIPVLVCAWSAAAAAATVPDVVGLAVDEAKALLEQGGFTATIELVQGRPPGIVVSQTPGGLGQAAKGTAVRLLVGQSTPKPGVAPPAGPSASDPGLPPTGPLPARPVEPAAQPTRPDAGTTPPSVDPGRPPAEPAAAMPDGRPIPAEPPPDTNGPALPSVLGQKRGQAVTLLANWRVQLEHTLSIPEFVGTVVNQRPHPGLNLAPGQQVTIVVAIAEIPGPTYGTVPKLEGLGLAEAQSTLQALGFTADLRSWPSSARQRGIVMSQSPLPGSLAPAGASVRVRVGRGDAADLVAPRPAGPGPQPAVPAQPTPADDGQPPAGPLPRSPLDQPAPVVPVQPEPALPPAQPVPTRPVQLGAPALLTPPANEPYPWRFGATFSWSPVDGVTVYEWQLEQEMPSGAWHPVDSRAVEGTRLRPDKMVSGRFRWRVRADTVGAWSEWRRLYLY